MKIIYIADTRIPGEKAHPYQIAQMCEAFAAEGADVTLIAPTRHNTPPYDTDDVAGLYGVENNFTFERLPSLDLMPFAKRLPSPFNRIIEWVAARLVTFTFLLALFPRLRAEREAIIYSRHPIVLRALLFVAPKRAKRMYFEAHTDAETAIGKRLRRILARRIGGLIVITAQLAERYMAYGFVPGRMLVAHDAIRAERFQIEGDQGVWRTTIGWPDEAFIVGYMGRFTTLGLDKGLSTLAQAVMIMQHDRHPRPVYLALVGGPAEYIAQLREEFSAGGHDPQTILYAGQVPPPEVPGYLRAFDVCTIPFPWAEFFAYYTSPLKLFEYMASGSPIVASDLPSLAEVLSHEENGLLAPPSDADALADALRRLRDNPQLASDLAKQAYSDVYTHYTWQARAQQILQFMKPPQDA